MFDKLSRSWGLVKASFEVLKKDKEIMLFPIFSGIFIVLLLFSFLIPLLPLLEQPQSHIRTYNVGPGSMVMVVTERSTIYQHIPFIILLLFAFYFLAYFIVIFFNVGLITCAYIRLNGGDPKVRDGLISAVKNIDKIVFWAVISATVGIVLKALEGRNGKSDIFWQVVVSLVGMGWSLLTFFVVPIMIFEGVGPIEAIKRSGKLFKKTWGENIIGQATIGLVFFLLGLVGAIIVIRAFLFVNYVFPIVDLIVALIYLLVLIILQVSLDGIFRAALYIYAKTGKLHYAFDKSLIQNAFQAKRR
ncbi:MAG: DUF6159 family protein [Candidatus Diapherotrites archaeon]|nr:DUF6159 family protein [Candidatus Diapherotrites archaeon]